MIRDRFVVGLEDAQLSEALQMDATLTLATALARARLKETVHRQQLELRAVSNEANIGELDVVRRTTRKPSSNWEPGAAAQRRTQACKFCGRSSHPRARCPARSARCDHCGIKRHFAVVCHKRTENNQAQGRHRGRGEGQWTQAGGERFARRRVLVIGDSNVGRAEQGVMARVKADGRVQVEAQAGKGMAEGMTKAWEVVGDSTEGDSGVIMHAGLNDVVKGRSQELERHIETRLSKLREASGRVHVTICTIPEVQGQTYQVERRVVEANRVIRSLSGRLGYNVMEVNRDVYGAGSWLLVQDGIHYSGATGKRIGGRMGRQATAFLGGPRALKEPV
ncbi:uncharacterized protein [Dermacentor andersoni]|uniref:uncharacterized protein n=1 Tax=Dermacentor andersoni TaxID=34620 RepID=UPI003B3A480E